MQYILINIFLGDQKQGFNEWSFSPEFDSLLSFGLGQSLLIHVNINI